MNCYAFWRTPLFVFLSCFISTAYSQCVGHAACTGTETIYEVNNPGLGSTVGYPFRATTESRLQVIYYESELTAAGMTAGTVINGINFEFTNCGSQCYANSTVLMGHTTETAYTGAADYETGLTEVASTFEYEATGVLDFSSTAVYFDTPFMWNGVDNLVMEYMIDCGGTGTCDIRYDGGDGSTIRAIARFTTSCGGFGLTFTQTRYPSIRFISCDIILPIELLEFDANRVNDYVQIEWETATEINNDYFTILRSVDTETWEEIGVVDGAGNSSAPIYYADRDANPYRGVSYYKLKQTDFDGSITYSDIRTVSFYDLEVLNAHPNPTDGLIRFNVFSSLEEEMTIMVTDTRGRVVYYQDLLIEKGENDIELDLRGQAAGTYTFTVASENLEKRSGLEFVIK